MSKTAVSVAPGRPKSLWRGMGFAASGNILLSIISNVLLLTGPIFMLQVYDRVLASKSVPTLVALTGLVLVLYGFYAVIELVRQRMSVRLAEIVSARMAGPVFQSMISAQGPDRRADPVRDMDTVRQFVAGAGPIALIDLPWMPLYLALVWMFHPMLGWLAVAGGVTITVLMAANEMLARRPMRDSNATLVERQAVLNDTRSNGDAIVAMGMGPAMGRRWTDAADSALIAQRRAADRAAFFSTATKAFRLFLQSAVLSAGAYLAIQGEISAGLMIAASIVSARALAPVEQIVANWRGFVAARSAWGRLKSILRANATGITLRLPAPRRSLVVEGLAVAVPGSQKALLHGLNFELNAGEGLGVIGISGEGKSSLARVLVGVWKPGLGAVRLDGFELSNYMPADLGRAIGFLPQTVELFDGTVAQNIGRFDAAAKPDTVIAAARAAGVHDLIASLPQGYETRVGERGSHLSAGQRQRIGLARALYGDPFLIVLDEPNSNLDSAGDAALNAALAEAKHRGAIIVVIAHRPSAIAAVDKLLFLQSGTQAACGPKDEVLRQVTAQPASLADVRKARAS